MVGLKSKGKPQLLMPFPPKIWVSLGRDVFERSRGHNLKVLNNLALEPS